MLVESTNFADFVLIKLMLSWTWPRPCGLMSRACFSGNTNVFIEPSARFVPYELLLPCSHYSEVSLNGSPLRGYSEVPLLILLKASGKGQAWLLWTTICHQPVANPFSQLDDTSYFLIASYLHTTYAAYLTTLRSLDSCQHTSCSFGLSATSQQYFSLRTNQLSATSQQYFSLSTNQHQPSATSQTNRLIVRCLTFSDINNAHFPLR
jgi:hypothetical protein